MEEDFFDGIGGNIEFMPDETPDFLPPDEKLPVNVESIDEAKIDKLLMAVRAHYTQLEEENSRLLQLSSLVKEKINACAHKEIESSLKIEPSNVPLNLEVANQQEEYEEDDEESS